MEVNPKTTGRVLTKYVVVLDQFHVEVLYSQGMTLKMNYGLKNKYPVF